MTQLLDSLGQGYLLACSDGSYDPITNTAAYGMVFGTELALALATQTTGQQYGLNLQV
jgi:hypothetical protein